MLQVKFPTRSIYSFFNLPNPPGRDMALGLSQPLTIEYQESCLENVGALTPHHPLDRHGVIGIGLRHENRTAQNHYQLIRDLFNQPEVGRKLNRMWPEDLIR
jgi:hypothetical protein